MKKIALLVGLMLAIGCSSSKNTGNGSANLQTELDEKNRGNVPLLTRIRQLPGVVLKNGVPTIAKNTNSISDNATGEPLYVLNGQIIGNSFAQIDELVDNFNIKSIKVLKGSEANFYGTQAASGVIRITTY